MIKDSIFVPFVFIANFVLALIGLSLPVSMWQYLMFAGNGNYLFLLYSFLHSLYLLLPLACIMAIFSAYIFMIRHNNKRRASFLLLFLVFIFFFTLVIPLIYSQGRKIDKVLDEQKKINVGRHCGIDCFEIHLEDSHLKNFLELPLLIELSVDFVRPLLCDIYNQYCLSYFNYIIFAGSIFLFMLSLWGCSICTEWKMLNFSLLPLFLIISLYGYQYIRSDYFGELIKGFFSHHISGFWSVPIVFIGGSILFFLYTLLLLVFRSFKKKNIIMR